MAKEKKTRISNFRLPWIPGFARPNYKLKIPEVDLSDPTNRDLLFISTIVFTALMATGFIYMLVNPPPALISIQKRPAVILPNLDRQTLSEGIVVFSLMLMAIGGLYLIRRSVEVMTESESRGLWLGLGYVLVLIAFLSLTYFLMIKIGIIGT